MYLSIHTVSGKVVKKGICNPDNPFSSYLKTELSILVLKTEEIFGQSQKKPYKGLFSLQLSQFVIWVSFM